MGSDDATAAVILVPRESSHPGWALVQGSNVIIIIF